MFNWITRRFRKRVTQPLVESEFDFRNRLGIPKCSPADELRRVFTQAMAKAADKKLDGYVPVGESPIVAFSRDGIISTDYRDGKGFVRTGRFAETPDDYVPVTPRYVTCHPQMN